MGSTTRSFELIQAISDEAKHGLTFTELVRTTGLAKSTAHRLLNELTSIGALRFNEDTRTYHGGLLLARLGASVAERYDLRSVARAHLEQLHELTGHTATLGVREGREGVYIDKVDASSYGIRLHSEIGKAFPLHCTGMGKAMLSQLPIKKVIEILGTTLERYTSKTITDKNQFREELSSIRDSGYAIDNEEITRGLVCIAAPIFGPGQEPAGALSCTFPTWIRDERGMKTEIDAVLSMAKAASLGWQ